MRQLLIIATAFIVISCGSKTQQASKFIPKSDTTKIQAVYIDYSDSLKIKNGIVFEIVRDAIDVDSVLKVNKVKDSIYFYRPSNDTTWKMILKPSICVYRNVDTCLAKLSRLVAQIKSKPIIKQ